MIEYDNANGPVSICDNLVLKGPLGRSLHLFARTTHSAWFDGSLPSRYQHFMTQVDDDVLQSTILCFYTFGQRPVGGKWPPLVPQKLNATVVLLHVQLCMIQYKLGIKFITFFYQRYLSF